VVDGGTEEGRRGGWRDGGGQERWMETKESGGVGAGNLRDVWGGAGRSGVSGDQHNSQTKCERTKLSQPLNIASMTEQKGHGD
jgi:hypothetical protein